MKHINKWFWGANILNALDALVTMMFMAVGLREMNPIMNYLISLHPALFIMVKLLALYVIALRWKRAKKLRMLQVGSGLLFGIVIWNVIQLWVHLS